MKIVKKSAAIYHKNEDTCIAFEYPMEFKDIDCATAEIAGRYPSKGVAVNEISKMFVYVIAGSGKLNIDGNDIQLDEGDLACIEPGEKYYYNGIMKIFLPCTPAWNKEQYKIIE
ncbi:MAG: hypothetical protein WCX69_02785 [Candidatus Paceibacterota bacterium]